MYHMYDLDNIFTRPPYIIIFYTSMRKEHLNWTNQLDVTATQQIVET